MFVADSFYCTALVKSFRSPLHPIMTASVNACKRTAGAFGRMEVARATTCREWWCQPCELLFSEDTFFLRKSDYSYLPAFLRASSNCCVSEAFGQIKSQLQTVLTLTPPIHFYPLALLCHWTCRLYIRFDILVLLFTQQYFYKFS